jgi:hypothetical protein
MIVLSLQHILVFGAILCGALGIIILGSLYYNPRLWLQDYPAEIRARVRPLNSDEKRQRRFIVVPVLIILIGLPVYSTYVLRMTNGGTLSFLSAYLNVFSILQLFNLFDAVVIDLLILTLMKPKFAIIPGAEGMEYLLYRWDFQLTNFLKGVIFCTVFSAPLALVTLL